MPALATQALLAGLHGGQDAANRTGRELASEPQYASQLYQTLAICGLRKAKGPAAPTAAVPLAEAAEAVAEARPLNPHCLPVGMVAKMQLIRRAENLQASPCMPVSCMQYLQHLACPRLRARQLQCQLCHWVRRLRQWRRHNHLIDIAP